MAQQTFVSKRIRAQQSYQKALHFHDVFELFFSLNNGSQFFLGDRVYDISRGVVVLIPEGTLHRKINPENLFVDSYAIHFPVSFLEEYSTPKSDLRTAFGDNCSFFQLPEERIDMVKPLFDRCTENPSEVFGEDIRRNMCLVELLLTLYPFISVFSQINSLLSRQTSLITNVIHYINEHISEPLSLDILSNKFFISKYNLCRKFKRETSFTLVQYINSNRVRMACALIREERQISNVGRRVGFLSASHFINTFRKFTGVTPRDCLKRYAESVSAPIFCNFSSQMPYE